jgi:MFS transporter, SP family, xylose:H+ symportor
MKNQPIYFAVIASLSGFLFGFDTVVISGANIPIKLLWNTSDLFHGVFIMSIALWGTLVGALLGNIPTDQLGRKNTLFWIAVLYFISAVGTALATDPYFFSVYRFLGGIAIGVSTIAAPAYISEISPYKNRGRLVGMFQFNIVLGILFAFVSNYLLAGVGGVNDWRFMMGIEAIPALIFLFFVLKIPESPRWLIVKKKKLAEGLVILNQILGENHQGPQNILKNISLEQETLSTSRNDDKWNNSPYVLAFLIAFFNQMSGINFILYYAPEIMERTGFVTSQSLLGAVYIGAANLIFTVLGLSLIDKIGRRNLMIIGSVGYLISLSIIILAFYIQANPTFNLFGMIIFICSHAIGQGTVIWVFISEIFNNKERARGQSFGAGIHWGMAAIIVLFGSFMITWLDPWQIFTVFLVFMIFQTAFVLLLMPETKGKPLECIQEINSTYSKPFDNQNTSVQTNFKNH